MKLIKVEAAFKAMENEESVRSRYAQHTQSESVLQVLYEHPEKIWWWPWELIGRITKDGHRLSHRAPARASDLAIHESHLVEHRSIGRFKVYRLRNENLGLIKIRLGLK